MSKTVCICVAYILVVSFLRLPTSEGAAVAKSPDRCESCHTVIDLLGKNFRTANRDQVRHNFMQACERTGQPNTCSNVNVTYFDKIYKHLEENLNPTDFCFLAEECSARTNINVGSIIKTLADLPSGKPENMHCELCKEVAKHLQDNLLSGSKDDLQKQLLDKCKQLESLKDECIAVVDEFYPVIYDSLLDQLKFTSSVCTLLGICSGPPGSSLFALAVNPQPIPKPSLQPVTNPSLVPTVRPTIAVTKPTPTARPSSSSVGGTGLLFSANYNNPLSNLFSPSSGFGSGYGSDLTVGGAGLGLGALLGAGAVGLPLIIG